MTERSEKIVYWMLLKHENWNMYMAATAAGLCYVGSPNASFDELAAWGKKRFTSIQLLEDNERVKPYAMELIDYIEGRRKNFSLPIDLHGTPFQQIVWRAMQEIPYGETVSYTDIAERINKPASVRAVGTAIGANPILITVPCHRVVAKDGKLTGYRGGLAMKKQLLELEKLFK